MKSSAGGTVRTRFAPSPTGKLHLGGARTALFCYLFAKKAKGQFILRFEDTDLERSKAEFLSSIEEDLLWLGLTPDESDTVGGSFGPYRQSKRLNLYTKRLEVLRKNQTLYPCFCSRDRLQKLRLEQEKKKLPPRYDGLCQKLSLTEVDDRMARGIPHTLRFRIASSRTQEVRFQDLVLGEIVFRTKDLEDFIVVREDQTPPFLFSSLVDDLEMRVTHVIRGNDHIANTPKQILLAKALEMEPPLYGHLPLILNDKGIPLSKREGSSHLGELRSQGFLPAAITQCLLLLGWTPPKDAHPESAWSLPRQIEHFSLQGLSRSSPRMQSDKMRSINRLHIRALSPQQIFATLKEFITKFCPEDPIRLALQEYFQGEKTSPVSLEQALVLLQGEVETLSAFLRPLAGLIMGADVRWSSLNFQSEVATPETRQLLEFVLQHLKSKNLKSLDHASLEQIQQEVKKNLQISGKKFFQPLRLALTGEENGPKLADILSLLGTKEANRRLETLLI